MKSHSILSRALILALCVSSKISLGKSGTPTPTPAPVRTAIVQLDLPYCSKPGGCDAKSAEKVRHTCDYGDYHETDALCDGTQELQFGPAFQISGSNGSASYTANYKFNLAALPKIKCPASCEYAVSGAVVATFETNPHGAIEKCTLNGVEHKVDKQHNSFEEDFDATKKPTGTMQISIAKANGKYSGNVELLASVLQGCVCRGRFISEGVGAGVAGSVSAD